MWGPECAKNTRKEKEKIVLSKETVLDIKAKITKMEEEENVI